MSDATGVVVYAEPGPGGEDIIVRVPVADAIRQQREAATVRGVVYGSDAEALQDFLTVHWAWIVEAESRGERLRRACAASPHFDPESGVALDKEGLPLLDDPRTLAVLRAALPPEVFATLTRLESGWRVVAGWSRRETGWRVAAGCFLCSGASEGEALAAAWLHLAARSPR